MKVLQCAYVSLKMSENVAGKINHMKIEVCFVIKAGGRKWVIGSKLR
jgi:hypothetical protein